VRPGAFGLAVLALVGAACGAGDPEAGAVQVFAAASLTEAFTALGQKFETERPDMKAEFNFAASSALARQINEGASADVFASAAEESMKEVTDAGNADRPRVIARNRLAILVEKGNPKGITGLVDLAKPDVVLVLCAPDVPCGRFAAAALAKAGVAAVPSSREENVKAVVSKVVLGEADAGIVYVTDIRAAGREAEGVSIDIARDPELEAVYSIAVIARSSRREAARAWLGFVLSDEGRATLARHGFLPP
jgi:molybdate transport system substrate-binding protein